MGQYSDHFTLKSVRFHISFQWWKSPKWLPLTLDVRMLARNIITAHNEVESRLCFYTCLWFCSLGGGGVACWDTQTLGTRGRPPQNQSADTPVPLGPEAGTPPTRHPPAQCMLGDTGNKQAGTTSYWNAILKKFSAEWRPPNYYKTTRMFPLNTGTLHSMIEATFISWEQIQYKYPNNNQS